jgi:hypothetical protein
LDILRLSRHCCTNGAWQRSLQSNSRLEVYLHSNISRPEELLNWHVVIKETYFAFDLFYSRRPVFSLIYNHSIFETHFLPPRAPLLSKGETETQGTALDMSSALGLGLAVNSTSRQVYPTGKTRYPLQLILVSPQGQRTVVEKRKPPANTGVKTPTRSARRNSIYPLLYPDPYTVMKRIVFPKCNELICSVRQQNMQSSAS